MAIPTNSIKMPFESSNDYFVVGIRNFPLAVPDEVFTKPGAGPSVPDLFRRSSADLDKILKGVSLGDLPVEQPTKFELAVNLKTTRALGPTVPPTLLATADEVIE